MEPPPRADHEAIGSNEIVAGRYRLDRSLGASGMAEVFAATDLQLRRDVAVKRLPYSAMEDATAKARFAREARALARVNDPHVVTVFDIVVDDGRPFLVMELVDGMPLSELIHREGRIEPARLVSIAEDICSGLAAVHACGIVHRDMKPSNVFLTSSGAVKIGDFGIASVASDVTVTRVGEVFGSAPYVSPEQVTGDPVDARADLYSLGCVMFEMATGRPPFVGNDPAALSYQHAHTNPERADAVVPQVPTSLASTIDRLLAKDPAHRPDSADELRRALEALPSDAADVGDVATQPLAPLPATDVLPVVSPPSEAPIPPRRPPRPSSPVLWIAGLVAGIGMLLVLNAIFGGTDPAVGEETPAARRSSSRSTVASTSPTTSPTSPPGAGVEDATAAPIGLIGELDSSGAVEGHLAKDLEHGSDEVVRALDGERALDALGRLLDKVDKSLGKGEISSEDAQRIGNAIQSLATAIAPSDG
jgi:eukaryotic-like serine/threonine-protein kinase